MTGSRRTTARVAELIERRVPFVLATVVRAEMPTSARPGDSAVVLADGAVEGFVGGQCAENSVKVAALGVLDSGEPLLLRVLPEGDEGFPDRPGAHAVVNPCLSGGAIEVFLDPKLPAPQVVVVGNTPIAESLAQFAALLGYAVDHVPNDVPIVAGALAVIISSHGVHEEQTIQNALDAGVGFIGLVASTTRGRAVIESVGPSAEERNRLHSPVGIDIGARTAEEVALSVLAELTKATRVEGLRAPQTVPRPRPAEAIDPVCGMTVLVDDDTPYLSHDGHDYWYCNVGCRTRHKEDLAIGAGS